MVLTVPEPFPSFQFAACGQSFSGSRDSTECSVRLSGLHFLLLCRSLPPVRAVHGRPIVHGVPFTMTSGSRFEPKASDVEAAGGGTTERSGSLHKSAGDTTTDEETGK